MFKKVLGLFAVVVVLTAVLTVTASAVTYWEEDFSNFDPSTGLLAGGTTITNAPTGFTNYSRTIENGALKIVNGASTTGAERTASVNQAIKFNISTANATEDVIVQYDIKIAEMPSGGSYLAYIYGGNKRSVTKMYKTYAFYGNVSGTAYGTVNPDSVADGNWYTYIYHFKKDASGAINGLDIYRKRTADPGQPTKHVSLTLNQIYSPSTDYSYYSYAGAGSTIYLDNFKCYSGNSIKNGQFKLDGNVIANTNSLANGTITAEAEVVLGQLSISGSSLSTRSVLPYMVAFDSDGKMVACEALGTAATRQLSYGENNLSFAVDASTYGASANGGYLGFYILDTTANYRAFVDPVELKAAQ